MDNARTVGRNATLRIKVQDTTLAFNDTTNSWLPLGAVSQKSFAIDGNVLESNDSSAISGFSESQIANSTVSLSVSGNHLRTQPTTSRFISSLMILRFAAAQQTLNNDMTVLIEYKRVDVTFTGYMIVKNISVDDPDAELSTWSMELVLAHSTIAPTLLAS